MGVGRLFIFHDVYIERALVILEQHLLSAGLHSFTNVHIHPSAALSSFELNS